MHRPGGRRYMGVDPPADLPPILTTKLFAGSDMLHYIDVPGAGLLTGPASNHKRMERHLNFPASMLPNGSSNALEHGLLGRFQNSSTMDVIEKKEERLKGRSS